MFFLRYGQSSQTTMRCQRVAEAGGRALNGRLRPALSDTRRDIDKNAYR
jgi:hypothetical protein